jgi:uncharacterized membrane protein
VSLTKQYCIGINNDLVIMSKIPVEELKELVNAGIIPVETAQRITIYYQQKKLSAPNTFIVILGIIGALLTGSGILLIVAHNWDDLSVIIKTILSFLPLLLGQSACVYTLYKRKYDRVWIECSSMLLFFAIGASISLISQIYQVNGSLPAFLLVWVLLSLPLIYILSSNIVALFCIAAITWYAAELGYNERYAPVPFMYAIVLACLVPHYNKLFKNITAGNFYILLNWFAAVSLAIALGCFVNKQSGLEEWVLLLYCVFFCIYYMIGRSTYINSGKIYANPFLVMGLTGVISLLLVCSYNFIWQDIKMPTIELVVYDPLFYLLAAGLVVVTTISWVHNRSRPQKFDDPVGYSFAILMVLYLHPLARIDEFIVNAWIVFIGISFIRKGSARNHLGIVNFGLIIIALLAICRFFDNRIPFIWRGIFFLVTGIAFFAGNYFLLRKRKQDLKPDSNA